MLGENCDNVGKRLANMVRIAVECARKIVDRDRSVLIHESSCRCFWKGILRAAVYRRATYPSKALTIAGASIGLLCLSSQTDVEKKMNSPTTRVKTCQALNQRTVGMSPHAVA